jgi:hypothetical protein
VLRRTPGLERPSAFHGFQKTTIAGSGRDPVTISRVILLKLA